MTTLHALSWLALLTMLPIVAWILWIKGRSAITCWVRLHSHPQRWLLSARAPKDSSPAELTTLLRQVVEQARSVDWDAAQTVKRRDPESGDWIVGLISATFPLNTETPEPFTFEKVPASTVIRLSGEPKDDDVTQQSILRDWSTDHALTPSRTACSLSAQSFQCWEWDLPADQAARRTSPLHRLAEAFFEMRIIILVPLVLTFLALAMLGTGNTWLLAVGVFLVILLSGACKFVFLHQREDATQESHLQNY